MGGDIVLDGNGRYGLIHVSQASTDRPSVQKLLDVIMVRNKGNQGEKSGIGIDNTLITSFNKI